MSAKHERTLRCVQVVTLCAIGLFLVSCVLLHLDGGFGGGHGDYDRAIYFLALPWILLAGMIPETVMLHVGDFALFAGGPLILNLAAIGITWFALSRRGTAVRGSL